MSTMQPLDSDNANSRFSSDSYRKILASLTPRDSFRGFSLRPSYSSSFEVHKTKLIML